VSVNPVDKIISRMGELITANPGEIYLKSEHALINSSVDSRTFRFVQPLRIYLLAMIEVQMTPLTGKALLQKAKELDHLPRREKAKSCGYYTLSKNKQERIKLAEFLGAILEAKGVSLDLDNGKDGRGREPTYQVTVHKNGQIVIGSTYTQEMGLKPGDEFEIRLGYKHIRLIQISEQSSDQNSDQN
jgi:AbrB-like transcriptional regulator